MDNSKNIETNENKVEIGMKFGQLTVVKKSHINKENNSIVWGCKCSCGRYINVKEQNLLNDSQTSCGSPKCANSLIGQKFGRWTVIAHDNTNPKNEWCVCDCGTKKSVNRYSLRAGRSKSCGCLRNEILKWGRQKAQIALSLAAKTNAQAHIGERYGLLTIVKPELKIQSNGRHRWFYHCVCDCGNTTCVRGTYLFNGHTVSCGCLNSKANMIMAQILKKYNIPFQQEYRFQDCRDKLPLPFDFCLFNRVGEVIGLIENNGKQHYSQFGTSWDTPDRLIERQKHDYIKMKFAEEAHIPLLIIPYQYFNELEKFLLTSEFWQIISKEFND